MTGPVPRIVLFANTDWYLYNFRMSLATALRSAGFDVVFVSPPGAYVERLQASGFRWVGLPMRRASLNPFREVVLLFRLYRLLLAEAPAVVHGFTIKCAVYGSLAARLAGIGARVASIAGMGYVFTSQDLRARILRPLVRALFRAVLDNRASRVIVQNPDDARQLALEGLVEASRIRLIRGSGVDCHRFAARPAGISRGADFRVVMASRMLWDKGVAEFVRAAEAVHREGLPIRFLLAGEPDDGNPASVPTDFLRAVHARGIVEWLGHVDDAAALYSEADTVVLPSYREGLPKSLIEAAACALPIITTDVPGCREVVRHESTGLLIPPRDAQALADAVLRLFHEPAFARRLGERARANAMECFDEGIVVGATLDVYAELTRLQVPGRSSQADGRPHSGTPGLRAANTRETTSGNHDP